MVSFGNYILRYVSLQGYQCPIAEFYDLIIQMRNSLDDDVFKRTETIL